MTICASCAANNPSRLCGCCQSVWYCNRACQRAHKRAHKRDRANQALMAVVAQQMFGNTSSPGGNASSSGGNASSSEANASSPAAQFNQDFKAGEQEIKPFTAISKNLFFHDRPEEKTFQLLIDTQHMRQQDELNFDGVRMPGSIHDNEASSEKAFREFILKAQAVLGYLPVWWKETSADACVEYARNSTAFSLAVAQEKKDVQKTWDDDRMPMKLRMAAERVYGSTPGGSRSDSMLAMMVNQEGGNGNHSVHVDFAGLAKGANRSCRDGREGEVTDPMLGVCTLGRQNEASTASWYLLMVQQVRASVVVSESTTLSTSD